MIIYYYNIFDNLNLCVFFVRGVIVYIYNNYYDGVCFLGINFCVGVEVKVENNYFENSKDLLGMFYIIIDGYW